jgi:phosphoribosylformylglycinamidine synthase II/phosphoribosylformylglycinamidine synthase I
MNTYRIEIRPTEPTYPHRSRLYFLRGENLETTHLEHLCREVLCDPVTETFRIAPVGAQHAAPLHENTTTSPEISFFETTLHPGVTDSAANSLLTAARVLNIPAQAAATGERLEYPENLTLETLKALAHERVNEVIERFTLNSEIAAPFIEHADLSSTEVEHIDLRQADNTRLLEISKERRLALDLAEMQAVQAYYRREDRMAADVELEMIAQTWSEHCVHKTFRAQITDQDGKITHGLLKSFIAKATKDLNKPFVRSAFVDNAGIIRFDDEFDVAVKVETHNHPSALEPFGGANTGVGGVIRDVLALGAKPIANMDVLCFGTLEQDDVPEGVLHPKRVQEGVVRGIEDYGNKMGIPTVNGAVLYHNGYTANPLVYCGCVGILPASEKNAAPLEASSGDLIVAIGGRTGRDGLRGATFSSLEMDTSTAEIASTSVQIGQPIVEKQVQEVILRARGLYSAMTDCGAGGFSSAVGEMGKHLGAKVQLENALLKYPGLRPWEIWLSEAQERMVMSVPPQNVAALQALCDAQDVELVQLGTFTSSGRLELFYGTQPVGALDLHFLHEGIPLRKLRAETPSHTSMPLERVEAREQDLELDLLNLLAHPNIRSREPIIRLYDFEVKGGTAIKPLVGAANHAPSDAAVVVPNPKNAKKALAISNGICPQFGVHDPYAMSFAAIDEAVRNAVCVGADPDQIAILDNFCWGNPTLPDRLGSLLETSRGCYDAAIAYGTPFVSGKDSLYNEYTGADGQKHAIPGTLLISAIGIVPDVRRTVTMDFKATGNLVYLLGETRNELGASHYAMIHHLEGGTVPQPIQNPLERYRKLHQAIQNGWIQACHDLSEGGLAVALAEMCIAGRLGVQIMLEKKTKWDVLEPTDFLFSESAGRILLEIKPEHTQVIEELFGEQLCTHIGNVTQEPDFVLEFYGAVILETDIQTLELAWRDEIAALPPTSPAEAQHTVPLHHTTNTKNKTLILHAGGTNRDHDAALAVELAGGTPEILHLNTLLENPKKLEDYGFLIIPGGFSYGDDLGAGVMWALALRERLGEELQEFVSNGKPVLGICNGFQTLVKAGLLPGGFNPRTSTLTYNQQRHFECRWVTLEVNQQSKSFWLAGLEQGIYTPIAHGEGRFLCDAATLAQLEEQNLVALRYTDNPNGSLSSIAGITNAAGNVLGLMPHPENHVFDWQHPRYHRGERGQTGLRLFQNALAHIS